MFICHFVFVSKSREFLTSTACLLFLRDVDTHTHTHTHAHTHTHTVLLPQILKMRLCLNLQLKILSNKWIISSCLFDRNYSEQLFQDLTELIYLSQTFKSSVDSKLQTERGRKVSTDRLNTLLVSCFKTTLLLLLIFLIPRQLSG